jgi:CheY-like chemotaxis protein
MPQTVLLVDPQPETRKLAAFMLGKRGYEILEAHDGAEAIRIFERHGDAIDLLLTEAVMYRIGGAALAERLREIKPALRVLLMSGRPVRDGDASVLRKPFTMAEISGRVAKALEKPKVMTAGSSALGI